MNELKDNIVEFRNNNDGIYNNADNLISIFNLILLGIVQQARKQCKLQNDTKNAMEIDKKLCYFYHEYENLLIRNNNISNEQLDTMCKEFQHILGNKYDAGFEVKYAKFQGENTKLINRNQPMYKKLQDKYNQIKKQALEQYNKQHNNI